MRLVDRDPIRLDPFEEGLRHFTAAEPDPEQAVYWFRLGAEAGDSEAQAYLGWCLLEGLGVPRDARQARPLLERASAAGSLTAHFHLARALVGGWGGPADAPRSIALYTAAAAKGHADAAFNLAASLEAGWGCQPDRLAAKALYLRARALGSTLKAPGLRIRQRELDAVRDLARRFEHSGDLARLIDERQREIALVKDLVRHPSRRSAALRGGLSRVHLPQLARLTAGLTGLAAAASGWFGRRHPTLTSTGPHTLAHDAGPTSIA